MAPIIYPTRGIGASTQARIGYVIIINTNTRSIIEMARFNIAIQRTIYQVLTLNNR